MPEPVVHLFDHVSVVTGFQWAKCGTLLTGERHMVTNQLIATNCGPCKGEQPEHRSKYRVRHK